MDFPFSVFAPDAGDLVPGVLMQADGAQPLQGDAWGALPSLSVLGTATALSGPPRGLFGYQTADGTWGIAGFTASTVELKLADDTWSSVDTGLSTTSGDDWCYARFGTKLLYSNTTQGMRAFDVEASTVAAVSAAQAPRWFFECGNILFLLDCLDNTGTRNNKLIRSTAFSDHTNTTTKGADYQPLESGGALIWGGKLTDTMGLVLQQRAVRLIQVGNTGNALWGIQSISEEFGAVGAKSCVSFDGAVYWLATDGFRKFSMGGGPERIGAGLVDQWFLDRVDQSDLSLVQGAIDPFRKNVLWRWKRSGGASDVIFEDVIGYNWQFKKWFTLTLQTTYLGFSAQTALTWDAVDASLTWDSYDVIWDSRTLQGGQPIFGAMNSAYKFGYFSGSAMARTFETGLLPNKPSLRITRARPHDNSSDGTLEVGVRTSMDESTDWKTGVAKRPSGRVPLDARGHYVAFRRNIPAASSGTNARGVDYVEASMGGHG